MSATTDCYDFSVRCRVCMKKEDILMSVFDTDQIVKELEFCTGVLITKEDALPKSMCVPCRDKLTMCFEFKSVCIKSDELMKKILQLKILNQIKIKKEDPYDSDCEIIEDVKEEPMKQENFDDYDDDFSYPEEECTTFLPPPKKKATVKRRYNKKSDKKKKPKIKNPKKKVNPLICEHCDLKFTETELLREHKKKEHPFPWICEVCGKRFAVYSSHYSHVKSHFPPQYKCDCCDYCTWQKSDLVKHCRIHSGIKNYVCEYCTKSFHTTSNLHEHIRRHHTSRKAHYCPKCDRAFYDSNKLRRHMDIHDNIKRFECEICYSKFSRRCQWKQHLLKQHNLSVPKLRPGRISHFFKGETTNLTVIPVESKIDNLEGNSSSIEETLQEKANKLSSEEKSSYMDTMEESKIFIRNPEKSIFMGNPETKPSILVSNAE